MLATNNLELKKPEGTDVVNINDINSNMDKLDIEVVKKASASVDGRMSKEDKAKLDGIASGANKYVHPSKHSAGVITQDSSHRFVTDSEKEDWSSKADGGHTHDERYYTESEINSKLSGKSNTTHTHDDRYYTESEINSKLNNINAKKLNNLSSTDFLRKYSSKTSGGFYSGTVSPTGTTRINYDGYFKATRIYNATYADLAEYMNCKEEDLSPGDVLIWNNEKGGLTRTNKSGDKRVVGVYSDTFAIALNAENSESKVPIGLSGRVKVKVKGRVKSGDLLTTSNEYGYAVSVRGLKAYFKRGNVFAKALEECRPGEKKRIWSLIMLD